MSAGKPSPHDSAALHVTGRARYGDDLILPGMLCGKILRSPHAHAKILSIDTSKAKVLKGVKAVVTSADIPDHPLLEPPYGPMIADFHDISRNVLAREKVLYDGHAVAGVAAYVLVAEVLLCWAALAAYRGTRGSALPVRVVAAAGVSLLYTGALLWALLVVDPLFSRG